MDDGTRTPLPYMQERCPKADVRVCLQSHGSKVGTSMYGKEAVFVIPENICVYFYTEHACIYRGEPENFIRLCNETGSTFVHQSYEALRPGRPCDNYLLEAGELEFPDGRPKGWASLNIMVNDLKGRDSRFYTTPENVKVHIFLKSLIDELISLYPGKKISIHLLMCRVDHSPAAKKDIGEEITPFNKYLHSQKVEL